MSYAEKEEYQTNEPLVIVQPNAYLKMLKHVLRFGSMAKDKSQYRECMGMLMGRLGKKKGTVQDVIVTDAVPVTNGSHIEVSFDEMDYVEFADINAEFAEKGDGVFNVGWYHSHPGLSVFLSTVDVNNHLGFQTTNPSAIAIVWDHQLLEQKDEDGNWDIGFETFRLTELGKGRHSDYAVVKTYVEEPKDVSYYKKAIKEVIDLQTAGHPPVFEISELPSIVGDFDPKPVDEDVFQAPTYEPDIEGKPAIQTVGISSDFGKPLIDYLNSWSGSINQSMKNQSVVLYQNLKKLRDSVEKKIESLQKWFKSQTNEVFYDVWADADTMIENRIKEMEPSLNPLIKNLTGSENATRERDELLKSILDNTDALKDKLSTLQSNNTTNNNQEESN